MELRHNKKIWDNIVTYMEVTKSTTLEEVLDEIRKDLCHNNSYSHLLLWSPKELESMKDMIISKIADNILLNDNL